MVKYLSVFLIFSFNCFGQSTENKRLEIKKQEIKKIIRAYQDTLTDIEFELHEIRSNSTTSRDFEPFYVFAIDNALLKKQPSPTSVIIGRLSVNTKLKVINDISDYYEIISSEGNGFVFKKAVLSKPAYTPPISRSYTSSQNTKSSKNPKTDNSSKKQRTYSSYRSSASRSYYRGPRGGCYYINSNGNKSYVDRSVCN